MKNKNGDARLFLIIGILVVGILVFLFLTPLGEELLWELGIISSTGSMRAHAMYAREMSAVGGLKVLISMEAVWHHQDADLNGKKDYWTYDISTFYRMYRQDGSTLVQAIDIAFARADGQPHPDDIFGEGTTKDWAGAVMTIPKSGYYYQAMLRDENGDPYNQNEVGDKKVKATNSAKFAFVAYPAVYGTSGIRTFIVSEIGTVYAIDSGSDKDKIVLQWPGADPTQVTGPDGTKWAVAD